MRYNRLITLLASVSHLVSVAAQKCYYPSGSEAKNDIPCNLAAVDIGSACCALNDTCLSNGLCFSQTGLVSRRTCTDQSWQSNGCAQYCQKSLTGVGQVLAFVEYSPGSSSFCCGAGYNSTSKTCASDPATPFTIHLGLIINNRTSGSTSPNTTSDSQNSVPSTITTSTTFTTTDSASIDPSSSNKDTAIGAGVGVPLGVALLIALGLLWRERRQKQRLRSELNALRDPSASATGNKVHIGDNPSNYRGDVHQLDDACVGELDGTRVNEMAHRPYD